MPGMSCTIAWSSTRELNKFPIKRFETAKSPFTPVSLGTLHGAEDGLGTNQTSRRRNALAAPQCESYYILQGVPKCKPPQSGGIGSQAFSSSSTLHVAYLQSNVKLFSERLDHLTLHFLSGILCSSAGVVKQVRRLHNFATILARPSTNIAISPNV